MTTLPDLLDKTVPPDYDAVSRLVNSPLWENLCRWLEEGYAAKPQVEYSRCGMRPGWNVKYKKAGRGLCTLYPEKDGFVALVVIGQREKPEAELALPSLSAYTQELYHATQEGMGQRWLMVQVQNAERLADVKQLIAIRRKPGTVNVG